MKRRSWWRWVGWVGFRLLRLVVLLVIVVLLLVAGTYWWVTGTEKGRELIRSVAESEVNRLIRGQVLLGEVARLSPFQVVLEGLAVRDMFGREVAHVSSLVVEPDLRDIIGGHIHIKRVVIEGPSAHLYPLADGSYSLLAAVGPADPAPPDEEPEPPRESGPPTRVSVPIIEVRDGSLQIEDPVAMGLHLEGLSFDASLAVGEQVEIGLRDFAVEAVAEDGPALSLSIPAAQAVLGGEAGDEVEAELNIDLGGEQLDIQADASDFAGVGGPQVDVHLHSDRLTPSLVRRLGLVADASLPEWLGLDVTVRGRPLGRLEVTADLATPGGALALSGEVAGLSDADVDLSTSGLQLGEVMAGLPPYRVSLTASATTRVEGSDAGERRTFSLHVVSGQLDDLEVPELLVSASLDADEARLERLVLPHLGDRFAVSGRVGFDGQYSAHVELRDVDLGDEPLLGRFLPDLAGRVDAEVDADYDAEAGEIDGRVDVSVARLDFADISLASGRVRGTARGPLLSPDLDLQIAASDLAASGTVIRRVDVRATGGPTHYHLAGDVRMVDGPDVNLDVDAALVGERLGVDGTVRLAMGGDSVVTHLEGFDFELGRVIHLGRVRIRHRFARIALTGSYDLAEGADIHVELDRLDLGLFDGRLMLPDLPLGGVVSGHLDVQGPPDRPVVDSSLRWREGRAGPIEGAEARVDLNYGERGFRVDADVDLAEALRLRIGGGGSFGRLLPPAEAFAAADFDVDVEVEAQDLALLAEIVPNLPFSSGALSATAHLGNSLDRPDIQLALEADALEVAGQPPLAVSLAAELSQSALSASVAARDETGPLVDLSLEAGFGLDELLSGVAPEELLQDDWIVDVDIPSRSLRSFNLALPETIPESLTVSVQGGFVGRPDGLPQGGLRIVARARPPPAAERVEGCVDSDEVSVEVVTSLTEGRLSTNLGVRVGGETVVEGTAVPREGLIEIVEALSDTPGYLPVVDVDLSLAELDVGRLPGVCREATGLFTGELTGSGLLGTEPTIQLALNGESITIGGSDPVEIEAAVDAESAEAVATLLLNPSRGGSAFVHARVPLDWEGPAPGLVEEAPIHAEVRFEAFPTAAVSGVVPILRRGEGSFQGAITVDGPIDALEPNGELTLRRVGLALPGVDQRLSNVDGRVTVSPQQIALEGFRAEDYGGTVRADARVDLEAMSPVRAVATIEMSEFPMRESGSIVAWLTTRAEVEVDLLGVAGTPAPECEEGELCILAVLRSMAVRLPDEQAGSVQSLEPNPDIVLVDQIGALEEQVEEVVQAADPTRRVRVIIDASEPFWVQRSDFSLQLTSDLAVEVDQAGPRIAGEVVIMRGTLGLLGKVFELERSTLVFDGGSEIDPELNIVAVHPLSRYPGDTVTATITGRLSAPNLRFSTTLPQATSESQIVQLLVTGRVDDEATANSGGAGQQVASFLSGLTAGILTVAARSELGASVPVIAVQTGDELGEVGVRAGFVLDSIIPSFLRGIVVGAYVEGFIQSEAEQGTGAEEERTWGATGGFLLELYYGLGFLTSMRIRPPSNWALDVLWQL